MVRMHSARCWLLPVQKLLPLHARKSGKSLWFCLLRSTQFRQASCAALQQKISTLDPPVALGTSQVL